jgi:hypothetical protein
MESGVRGGEGEQQLGIHFQVSAGVCLPARSPSPHRKW